MVETEKIPIAFIYKKNGSINVDFSSDVESDFELYGFLKLMVKNMEDDLREDISMK